MILIAINVILHYMEGEKISISKISVKKSLALRKKDFEAQRDHHPLFDHVTDDPGLSWRRELAKKIWSLNMVYPSKIGSHYYPPKAVLTDLVKIFNCDFVLYEEYTDQAKCAVILDRPEKFRDDYPGFIWRDLSKEES